MKMMEDASLDQHLKTVTVRIAYEANGGIRAWSDDLPDLGMTCANHEDLFLRLETKIRSALQDQGWEGKIVREIHQYIVEVQRQPISR